MNQISLAESVSSEQIRKIFFKPVDSAFLVFFRITFGAIMLWEVFRYFTNGWIYRYYIEPEIYFSYYGFSWIKPLPGDLMYLLFFALGISCAGIITGIYYRLSAIFFFLGFSYVFLIDQTQYLNHFYLIILLSFLLIFLPAGRSFSIDVWRKPEKKRETAAIWNLYLLRFQIGIVYLFGGVAKINADWLQGEPMRMWLAKRTDFPLFGQYFTEDSVVCLFALGGLYFDLLIVPLILWKRTRIIALALAVCFHLLNFKLFNIGIFPWMMIGATLIFFPPEFFRKILNLIGETAARLGFAAPKNTFEFSGLPETFYKTPPKNARSATLALLAVYAAFQIGFPLRHFVYPNNVNWTEEGHKFSWHMKLRDKKGKAVFQVSSPASGEKWKVYPSRHLNSRQIQKMATHPEMILQYSHFLAKEKSREGYQDIEVRAHTMVSLNGRQPQPLVDPSVNLAAQQPTLAAADWILPISSSLKSSVPEASGELSE